MNRYMLTINKEPAHVQPSGFVVFAAGYGAYPTRFHTLAAVRVAMASAYVADENNAHKITAGAFVYGYCLLGPS